jgi:hypothetical protein
LAPDGTEKASFATDGSQVRSVAVRPDGRVMVVTRGGHGTIVFDTAGTVVHEARYSMDDVTVFADNSFALAGAELMFLTPSGDATNRHFASRRDHWFKPVELAPNKIVGYGYDTDTHEAHLGTFDKNGALIHDHGAFNLGAPIAAIDPTTVLTKDLSGHFVTLTSCW